MDHGKMNETMGEKMSEKHSGKKVLEGSDIRRVKNGFVVRVSHKTKSKDYPSMDDFRNEEHVFEDVASMAAFVDKLWSAEQS